MIKRNFLSNLTSEITPNKDLFNEKICFQANNSQVDLEYFSTNIGFGQKWPLFIVFYGQL